MLRGVLGWLLGAALFGVAAKANAQYGPRRADVPPRPEPEQIRATETVGCPPGYHPDTEIRYGPVIGGAITTGFGVLLLGHGIANWQVPERASGFLVFMGTVHLAVGLPLLSYGLLSPRDVYVRDSQPRVAFGILPSPENPRVAVTGTF